jgi:hypothetical protein
VIKELLEKVEEHHVIRFFQINRSEIPKNVNCCSKDEARDFLDSLSTIDGNEWLINSLRHIEGFCAKTLQMATQLPDFAFGVDNPDFEDLDWIDLEKYQYTLAFFEIPARVSTAIMFNTADTDGNGTLSFDEYFAFRAKSGGVPAEMKAKFSKEFAEIDLNGDGHLDFEEVMDLQLNAVGKLGAISGKILQKCSELKKKFSMQATIKKALIKRLDD